MGKKMKGLLLSLAMIFSLIIPISVYADNAFTPDGSKQYAIVADNKAIQMRIDGFMGPSDTNNVPHLDGTVSNGKVTEKTAFKIDKADEYYSFYCEATNGNYLEVENGGDKVFTYHKKEQGARNESQFKLSDAGDGKYKIESRAKSGYYLKVGEAGVIYVTDQINEATSFEFQEVKVLETTVKIESTTHAGYYLSYKDKATAGKVSLVKNTTDTEKFNVVFAECPKNDNFSGDVIETIAFQAKNNTNLYIGGNRYDNGPTINISFFDKAGGWESLVVERNSDGTFSLRDPSFGKYVVVNDKMELEGGHEESEKEKFTIHTDTAPLEVTNFKTTDVTDTQVDFSWTAPVKTLFSGYEIVRATDEDFTKDVKNISIAGTTYSDTSVEKGKTYYYKICTYVGKLDDDTLRSEYTDKVAVTVLSGARPTVPTGLKVKEASKENTVSLSWDVVGNAKSYKVYRADSAYGEYKELATVTTNSYEHTYDKDKKYENYYKVIAVNDFANSKMSDFVSLEKNLFGERTIIFAPTDDVATINKIIEDLFNEQNDYAADAQFKGKQTQVYFKKGDYKDTDCMNLGFYTSFNGLGRTPRDVELNNIAIPAYLPANSLGGGENNATCNFWRSAENLSVIDTHKENGYARNGAFGNKKELLNWAVAQAAPLRRIYSDREVGYDWNFGWASGGYVADCYFENTAGTGGGQQFYTRNSVIKGNAYGTTLNNFYQGVESDSLSNVNGKSLIKGNGTSNWSLAGNDSSQQVITNVDKTPEISEKPFLYLDTDGEYKVFVPSLQQNTKGVSWTETDMGKGTSLPLSDFFVAKPTDSAATINSQLAAGKNIYFTPGTYHAEVPIQVNNANTILLGTGMCSIIPDNSDTAMRIADVDGVRVAGLIFDAGEYSQSMLEVGTADSKASHASHPTILQDLFFRIGGTTNKLTKADDALIVNSNDVIGDHFWIWRADHGTGVTWEGNKSKHGLIVNGDNVTCYALFNEHFQEYDTLWNGENGSTYFYQNEKCYDPIDQDGWMSHNGTVNGYSAYKVSEGVKKHYAVGLGIYNVFIYTGGTANALGDASEVSIQMDNAIEVPNSKDVIVENACIQTFANADGALQKFNHIINGVGQPVTSGIDKENALIGEGWSRKFLISYKDGTAVVGNTQVREKDTGKFGGIKTISNIKEPSDTVKNVDKTTLNNLYKDNSKRFQDKYTTQTWKVFETALANAKKVIDNTGATQTDIDNAYNQLLKAIDSLKLASEGPSQTTNGGHVYESETIIKETQSHLIKSGGNLYITEENVIEDNSAMNNPSTEVTQGTNNSTTLSTGENSQTQTQIEQTVSPVIIVLSIVGGLSLGTAGTYIYFDKKRRLS